MPSFEVTEESIPLPLGAFAKARRVLVRWRGQVDHGAQSRAVPRLPLSALHPGRRCGHDRRTDRPSASSVGLDRRRSRLLPAALRRRRLRGCDLQLLRGRDLPGASARPHPRRRYGKHGACRRPPADRPDAGMARPGRVGRAATADHRHRDADARHNNRPGCSLPGHPLTPAAHRVGLQYRPYSPRLPGSAARRGLARD